MAQLVREPARRAGDPGSNPGPGENFSLKLLISIYQMVILKAKIFTTNTNMKYNLKTNYQNK